jgi:hypothetical protein
LTRRYQGDTGGGGWAISLLSEPVPERTVHLDGGWTLDALDCTGTSALTACLTNALTLDAYPDLKEFPD